MIKVISKLVYLTAITFWFFWVFAPISIFYYEQLRTTNFFSFLEVFSILAVIANVLMSISITMALKQIIETGKIVDSLTDFVKEMEESRESKEQ